MQQFPSFFYTQTQGCSQLEGNSNMIFAINLNAHVFQEEPEATPNSLIWPFPKCWHLWIGFLADPIAIHFLESND